MFVMSTELSDHLKKVHNKDLHPWTRIGKVIINEDNEDDNEDED